MPVVWRLVDPRFAQALDGEGNRRFGARWNSPGRGVVYTSENLSLCVLETWVHLTPAMRRTLPPRTAVRIDIPGNAPTTVLDLKDLPVSDRLKSWCRAKGDAWLADGVTLVLSAPSFVVPQERNLMLNPVHPDMVRVRIESAIPFSLDPRLAGGEVTQAPERRV